jgi:Xaa-Pro aminopeptidase
MFDLKRAQEYMHLKHIDAWLVYDFRGSNPIFWQLLNGLKPTGRRAYLLIPNQGEPQLLVHFLDKGQFENLPYKRELYTSWAQMRHELQKLLNSAQRLAMEYSPGAALPIVSYADAGTVELIRSFGVEVISSANLFQMAAASWTPAALDSQLLVAKDVSGAKDKAFELIARSAKAQIALTEYDVQDCIMQEFEKRRLETPTRANVSVNANSGNPHYEPMPDRAASIKKDDWVLIDLWARYPGQHNVFADMTWVGYVGQAIPSQYQKIFDIVRGARDAVLARLTEAWTKSELLQGYQLDDVARSHITNAGYGQYFFHRTGHSMGPGATLHALGVNLDNYETHDTREILPGLGFSVEPGIYLPEFGVRSEINVFVDPKRGPIVTTPIQEEILRLV